MLVIPALIAGLMGCDTDLFTFEEYDEPTVPEILYIPPVDAKLAAVIGSCSYLNYVVSTNIPGQDPSYEETDIEPFTDASGHTFTFNSEKSYFSEAVTTEMYEDETTSFISAEFVTTTIKGYTAASVDVGFTSEGEDPILTAENFSMTATSPLYFTLKGDVMIPDDESEDAIFYSAVGIYDGEFQCNFTYEGEAYSYTLKFEDFYYSLNIIDKIDLDTNTFKSVYMINYGGLVTIDGQKFSFDYSITIPKSGNASR